jgi:hypothetical protein
MNAMVRLQHQALNAVQNENPTGIEITSPSGPSALSPKWQNETSFSRESSQESRDLV